jgi:small subunit ribosomal protein S2
MEDISLKTLLEAGCHFGHKVDRWHPKAAQFIYQAREGIHIIDLAKTRDGLRAAADFVRDLGSAGRTLLLVATKRQAKPIVTAAAKKAGLPYMTNRWLGGFLTNWDVIKKNIDRVNRMRKEQKDGSWSKFPKHEQVKLAKELKKLEAVYGGVALLTRIPDAMFIVDLKKEIIAYTEAIRKNVQTVAMVDTNADPTFVDFPVPSNDDAVGSIECITSYLTDAYSEGAALHSKVVAKEAEKAQKEKEKTVEKAAALSIGEKTRARQGDFGEKKVTAPVVTKELQTEKKVEKEEKKPEVKMKAEKIEKKVEKKEKKEEKKTGKK